MTKKDSKDLSTEERLKTLYQLQTTLSEIDEERALRGELPLEVQDLEDEIEGLNTRVENIQEEIKEFKDAIVQKKKEIEEAQTSIARYKQQLDDVRNNREYDTLSKEIEFQSLEVELCNKKIREALVRIDERKEDEAAAIAERNERQADLDSKKAELEAIMKETREVEEKLQNKAKNLETKIESRLLNSFLSIRQKARNGLGIVTVQRDACGGCFNKIPPQRQLDIKSHKKVIVCEYCGRILIDPELAGIKAEETQPKKTSRKQSAKSKTEEATSVANESAAEEEKETKAAKKSTSTKTEKAKQTAKKD